MSALRYLARPLPMFLAGALFGLLIACGFSEWFEHVLKRAEHGVHQLTADISPETLYPFRRSANELVPLAGTIKAGSEFRIEMRKGALSYISFHTVVPTSALSSVSVPRVPEHSSVSPRTPSVSIAGLQGHTGLPNLPLQRTRFTRR